MEQIKFYAKTASSALLRWLLLFGGGLLLSGAGFVLGLCLLANNAGAGWARAAMDELWSSALLLGSLALPAVYFVLANKISFGFVLYELFENKLLPLIGKQVARLTSAFIANRGRLSKRLGSVSTLRNRLLALAGEDGTLDKIQRRAIRYGLARVRLDDLDFRQPDINLPEVIAGRVVDELQSAAEPGYQLFWIVATGHAALLILALLFDHG